MRTMPMNWGKSRHDSHPDGHDCAVCGKWLNPQTMWAVHVISGGASVLHPDDEAKYTPDGGDMGCHMVGPECRKQFGAFAFRWCGQ